MTEHLDAYARDPVAFIDDHIKVNERGEPFRLFDHQREILRAAFAFDSEGRLPWDTFVFSTTKKAGKTTINAAVTIWWAYVQEPPNELFVLANDQEQAQARTFSTAARLITRNPALAASAEVQASRILLSNGSEIRALASEFRGAAGSNHGLTSWDELWAYTSEASRRLWDELTGVPTRRNSIRFVSTYAGWEGESDLLFELYKLGVGPEEHPAGQGERLHPTLPLYLNREARLLVLWDHEPRMPWQSARYLEAQRRSLRPGTYLRLHENRWVSSESAFVTAEQWDACVAPEWSELEPSPDAPLLYVGVDLGLKHDAAAVVAVGRDEEMVVLCAHRLWYPTGSAPLDLEATVEAYLRALHGRFRLRRILCDPWQAARSIATLKAAGLPIEEFPQVSGNLTKMAETLYNLITSAALVVHDAPELRTMVLNATVAESERGVRLTKTTAGRRIDGAVALSMACVAAVSEPALEPARIW